MLENSSSLLMTRVCGSDWLHMAKPKNICKTETALYCENEKRTDLILLMIMIMGFKATTVDQRKDAEQEY